MGSVRKVVVTVHPVSAVVASTGMVSARFPALGLSAYGDTYPHAFEKLQAMVVSSVQAHREQGTLPDWLDRSGAEWAWEDQYTGKLPVRDGQAIMTSAVRKITKPRKMARESVKELALVA